MSCLAVVLTEGMGSVGGCGETAQRFPTCILVPIPVPSLTLCPSEEPPNQLHVTICFIQRILLQARPDGFLQVQSVPPKSSLHVPQKIEKLCPFIFCKEKN